MKQERAREAQPGELGEVTSAELTARLSLCALGGVDTFYFSVVLSIGKSVVGYLAP